MSHVVKHVAGTMALLDTAATVQAEAVNQVLQLTQAQVGVQTWYVHPAREQEQMMCSHPSIQLWVNGSQQTLSTCCHSVQLTGLLSLSHQHT